MIKVSNVLFVLFLICFTTSKQLQGQVARLPLKESKQKIAELINEMIPKETREALEKEGLLEKNFTKEVYSTVVEDMTNDELLAQAKQQKTQEKKKAPKIDIKTCKEATELIEYVLSDNETEQSEQDDKNGETAVVKTYKITTIRKPEQEYPKSLKIYHLKIKKNKSFHSLRKLLTLHRILKYSNLYRNNKTKLNLKSQLNNPRLQLKNPSYLLNLRPPLNSLKSKMIRKLN